MHVLSIEPCLAVTGRHVDSSAIFGTSIAFELRAALRLAGSFAQSVATWGELVFTVKLVLLEKRRYLTIAALLPIQW
jgi:hypothetical protein